MRALQWPGSAVFMLCHFSVSGNVLRSDPASSSSRTEREGWVAGTDSQYPLISQSLSPTSPHVVETLLHKTPTGSVTPKYASYTEQNTETTSHDGGKGSEANETAPPSEEQRQVRPKLPSSVCADSAHSEKSAQICQQDEPQRSVFSIVVGIMIITVLIVLIVYGMCRKVPAVTSFASSDDTSMRRYSVLVVHAWEDDGMVKTDLVNPLTDLGYMVAWNENVFLPGRNIEASIEEAVTNSRRMIVVASKNLLSYVHAKHIILRGLAEERNVLGFKVVALVMDDLPILLPNRALYDIVAVRSHVPRISSNYIRRMCDFLPAKGPPHIIYITETDLRHFILQQVKKQQRREKKRADNQRARLQEVFPNENPDGPASYVGASNLVQKVTAPENRHKNYPPDRPNGHRQDSSENMNGTNLPPLPRSAPPLVMARPPVPPNRARYGDQSWVSVLHHPGMPHPGAAAPHYRPQMGHMVGHHHQVAQHPIGQVTHFSQVSRLSHHQYPYTPQALL